LYVNVYMCGMMSYIRYSIHELFLYTKFMFSCRHLQLYMYNIIYCTCILYILTYINIYIYIQVYVFNCVHVCICMLVDIYIRI